MIAATLSYLFLGAFIISRSKAYHTTRSFLRLYHFDMNIRSHWKYLYRLHHNPFLKDKRLKPACCCVVSSSKDFLPSEERKKYTEMTQLSREKMTLLSSVKVPFCSDNGHDRCILQFDGGSRGNPGISGYGFVLRNSSGETMYEACGYLGKATNNEAEYNGLLSGLRCANKLGIRNLSVEGDSLLVVRQIKGEYAVKADNLKPLYHAAIHLCKSFKDFSIRYIPREENQIADQLANEAMDRRESRGL